MSYASIILLLQLAMSLLTAVQQSPSLPLSLRDNAMNLANEAIQTATVALGSLNATPTSSGSSEAPMGQISNEVASNTSTAPLVQSPDYKLEIIDLSYSYFSRYGAYPVLKIQFGDKNNTKQVLDGHLLVVLDIIQVDPSAPFARPPLVYDKYNNGEGYKVILYDSYKEINNVLPNPFVSEEKSLVVFPKYPKEAQNYFLSAVYDGKLYRISLEKYFNFNVIDSCEGIVDDFREDIKSTKIGSFRSILNLDGAEKVEALRVRRARFYDMIVASPCNSSLRYRDLTEVFANYPTYGDGPLREWIKRFRSS